MILALESSCDETAVAMFDPAKGLLSEWIHTQIALHGQHGGVVPDLATREHLRNFAPMLERAKAELGFGGVTAVAVTSGPGLAACLAVGVSAAKALALGLEVPVVGVNHLRAHAFSPFIATHAEDPIRFEETLAGLLPHLGLIVSGGNTILCEIDQERKIRLISTTRDDAAGEALDKGAKLLGLGYPGGPLVEKFALDGNPAAYDFPRGLGRRDNLDFSFSGLKTSLRYRIEKMTEDEVRLEMSNLCASYQQAVIDALTRKMRQASEVGDYKSIGLSGGVANNMAFRDAVSSLGKRQKLPLYLALPRHTGDNSGMIAFAAWVDRTGADRDSGLALEINPNAPVYN